MGEIGPWIISIIAVALAAWLSTRKTYAQIPIPIKETVPFDPLFNSASARFGVSKRLLAAIVKVESNFNPRAINEESKADVRFGRDVDSIGLGQILWPDTAKDLDPSIELEQLYDPATNLSLTARHTARKLRAWSQTDADGFPAKAVAAYNAGSPRYKTDGYFVNQSYVDKVKLAWKGYANV